MLGARNQSAQTQVSPTVSQLSQTADPTADWKTFIKIEDGYSIQYPDSLRYVGNSGGIGPSDEWESKDRRYNISVQLFSIQENPPFEQANGIVKSDETIVVKGQKVRKVLTELSTGISIDIGPIKNKDLQYILHYFGTKEHESSGISIFNQMISTFQFVDQGQARDTADWKTYDALEEAGFSLKYPSNWQQTPPREGCGPIFRPSNTQKVWMTVCGPNTNSFATPESLAKQSLYPEATVVNKKEIQLDGHPGVRQEIKAGNETNYSYQVEVRVGRVAIDSILQDGSIERQKGVISIYLYIKDSNKASSSLTMFDQILTTFKFSN